MTYPNPSPTPWRITDPSEKKAREIVDANGSTVARLTALDMANARYIVIAANAYAESNKTALKKLARLKSTSILSNEWERNITEAEFALEQRDKPTLYYKGASDLVRELIRRGVDSVEAGSIINHLCVLGNDMCFYPNGSLHSILVYMHKDFNGKTK